MVNQKKKGSRIELELVHWLKNHGIESARRTQQFSGKEGTSDIVAPDELPNWHIESKGTKSSLLTRSAIRKWLFQVKTDSKQKYSVILNKANSKDLIAIVPFSVWKELKHTETSKYSVNVVVAESINAVDGLAESQTINKLLEHIVSLPIDQKATYYFSTDPMHLDNRDLALTNIAVILLAEHWLQVAILNS